MTGGLIIVTNIDFNPIVHSVVRWSTGNMQKLPFFLDPGEASSKLFLTMKILYLANTLDLI